MTYSIHRLFLVTLVSISGGIGAQCPTGNVTLSSQTAINNFPPGCTGIAGNLTISESSVGNITDLSPLSELETVTGRLLVFDNSDLLSLTGLDNISVVSQSLRISKNNSLVNLTGLGGLTSVSSFLEIDNNSGLLNLSGISGEIVINGRLIIESNNLLQNLDGLSGITQIGDATLEINANPLLSDIGGLNSIDPASVLNLLVTDNTTLATCEEPLVCEFLAIDGSMATISGNAIGCDSQVAVENACLALPVRYTFFTASESGKGNLLEWGTGEEIDNRGFHIEHSLDGEVWQELAFIDGFDLPGNYDWKHDDPVSGDNFYRLLQEDFDGSLMASPVRVVTNTSSNGKLLSIFPNPARTTVNITGVELSGDAEIRLINQRGKVVKKGSRQELLLIGVPSGFYCLQIADKGEFYSTKLIVRK